MKRSTVLSFLVAVMGFGVVVPFWKGLDFLDSNVLLASTAVSLVFVAPMVASSFERQHVGRQILKAVGFGWLLALLILVNGIVTVNLTTWLGQVLLPPSGVLIAALFLNLAGAFFLGVVTAETALRTGKPALGVRNVRIGFILILATLVFLSRFASPSLRSRFDEMMTTEGLLRIVLFLCMALAVLSALLWRRIQVLSQR